MDIKYVDILIGENFSSIQDLIQFVYTVGGDEMGLNRVLSHWPAVSKTLLEYIKMWCNIHGILYPL